MTKEDIIEAVALGIFSLEQILDEFFSQNVVIPKGENRHPYADVLHAYAEGATTQWDYGLGWVDIDTNDIDSAKYRIKPQEPIYEWQYAVRDGFTKEWTISKYFTDDEAKVLYCHDAEKIEKTKRERKCSKV